MAATLNLYAYTAGNTTSLAASSSIALDGDSCLSFGSGNREQFQQNITINTYNTTMHYAQDNLEASVDMCRNTHLPAIRYIADTGCSIQMTDGSGTATYIAMANGTPKACRGIAIRFREDTTSVRVNPAQVWAGSGVSVDGPTKHCMFKIVDLTSSIPTWYESTVAAKGTLKPHGTTCQEHWWAVGVSVKPTEVGFHGDNLLKVELTYY